MEIIMTAAKTNELGLYTIVITAILIVIVLEILRITLLKWIIASSIEKALKKTLVTAELVQKTIDEIAITTAEKTFIQKDEIKTTEENWQ